jgi:hypothetical protein
MPHTVIDNGECYATMKTYDEAERYLADLKKVNGYAKLDIRDAEEDEDVTGRWPGEDKVLWGCCVCWDFVNKKVSQFYRKHIWEREVTDIKRTATTEKFQWFYLDVADEEQATKLVTKAMYSAG